MSSSPPQSPQGPAFGLGNLSSWANLSACVVMFYLFYQAQQNAFEMYRQDKIESQESIRRLWDTTSQMQRDSVKQTELMRQMQSTQADSQKVMRDMLDEIKRLKTGQ